MTPPKSATTPNRATGQNGKPKEKFFDQFIWHHRVHEHLDESLRYFLLKISPYNEIQLSKSLEQLVEDNHISGLRAYRVFGRNDLMVRGWMHNKTYSEMPTLFTRYLQEGEVRLNPPQKDVIERVEYRWYWKEAPPSDAALARNSELMIKLRVDPKLVKRIESGREEDDEIFKRYRTAGLIIPKQSTENTITVFICVRVDDNFIRHELRKKLVDDIQREIARSKRFLYPEIDSASGLFCNLIIRARTKADDYFEVGDLIRWLTTQDHVVGTETYLSLTEHPLFGSTGLSLATSYARQQVDPYVDVIFHDPFFPNGPYPPDKWGGKIAEEVVAFLRERGLIDPPLGLKKFLNDYLLAAMRNKSCLPALHIFPELERHLRDHHMEYIKKLGLKADEVYERAEVTGRQHLMLENLLRIYFRAAKIAAARKTPPEPVQIDGYWEPFLDVRNKTMHGADHYWKTGANTMIEYWPKVQLLCKEIESVCESDDRYAPEAFRG